MSSITIGFSRPKTWKPFAWLIMKAYRTNYDHVYIKFHSNTYDRDIIYQASSVMVNFMSPVVFQQNNIVVKEFQVDVPDENYAKLMQFCIDNAGKPYSLKEVLGFACVIIAGWFGKKISNPLKSGTEEYVCSVLAGYILDNFTKTVTPSDYEDASPPVIYALLEKSTMN